MTFDCQEIRRLLTYLLCNYIDITTYGFCSKSVDLYICCCYCCHVYSL